MKKFLIMITLVLGMTSYSSAITYEEVINNLKSTSPFKNIETTDTIVSTPIRIGNLLQMDNVTSIVSQNQTGADQTEYYGSLIMEQMQQLPLEEIVSSYIGESVMMSVYARPTQVADTYDLLILYDTAQKGYLCAIKGQIPQKTYDLLQSVTIAYDGFGNLGLYTKLIGFGAHY